MLRILTFILVESTSIILDEYVEYRDEDNDVITRWKVEII